MKKCLILLLASAPLWALPENPDVIAGAVDIVTDTVSSCQINQLTDKAIINWDSFSIRPQEAVNFIQPSASSVVLNRVVGGTPSEIYGQLTANGQVFLVNPQGVLFAPGAMVNTAGLVASTLALLDHHFMEGNYHFQGVGGAVINRGMIEGPATLLGRSVINEGEIVGGYVNLAAGSEINLALNDEGTFCAMVTREAVEALVSNSGAIRSESVFLSAQSASAVLETVVNNEGIIKATTLSHEGGRIVLRGGSKGVVQNSGRLDASGTKGGTISMTGRYVAAHGHSDIRATGEEQGGIVHIGFEGDIAQVATKTWIGDETKTDVSSSFGDAGAIRVWSEEGTFFYGQMKADSPNGFGGLVETSSQSGFDLRGHVSCLGKDTSSTGCWLLDPTDLTINHSGTDTGAPGFVGGNWVSNNSTDTLGDTVINSVLASSNVLIDVTAGSGAGGASVTFDATTGVDILIPANRTLTFKTGAGGFTMPTGIAVPGINGPGNLTIDAGTTGAVTFGAMVAPGGGVVLGAFTITDCSSVSVANRIQADMITITAEQNIDVITGIFDSLNITSHGGAGNHVNLAIYLISGAHEIDNVILTGNPTGGVNISYSDINPIPLIIATGTNSWNSVTPVSITTFGTGDVVVQGFIEGSTVVITTDNAHGILAAGGTIEVPASGTITMSSNQIGGTSALNIDMPGSASVSATITGAAAAHTSRVDLHMTNALNTSQVTVTDGSGGSNNFDILLSAPSVSVNGTVGLSGHELLLQATGGNLTFTGGAAQAVGSAIDLLASGSILNQSSNVPIIATTGPLVLKAGGTAGYAAAILTVSDPSKIFAYVHGKVKGVSVDIDGTVGDNTIHFPPSTPGYVILNGRILNPILFPQQYRDAVIYVYSFLASLLQDLLVPGSIEKQAGILRVLRPIET